MIYEYRRYQVAPGQRNALHQHMTEIALPVFAKVGIRPIGFWEPAIGEMNMLHYVVPYESLADREQRWNAWLSHPERRLGILPDGSRLVDRFFNEFWSPTEYSVLR